MSYEPYLPTTWSAGDIISSAKLNKIENGIANNGIFLVNGTLRENVQYDQYQLDKTFQEIEQASTSKIVVLNIEKNNLEDIYSSRSERYLLVKTETSTDINENGYILYFFGYNNDNIGFVCDNKNEYPHQMLVE